MSARDSGPEDMTVGPPVSFPFDRAGVVAKTVIIGRSKKINHGSRHVLLTGWGVYFRSDSRISEAMSAISDGIF